jgi:hypothetical protein
MKKLLVFVILILTTILTNAQQPNTTKFELGLSTGISNYNVFGQLELILKRNKNLIEFSYLEHWEREDPAIMNIRFARDIVISKNIKLQPIVGPYMIWQQRIPFKEYGMGYGTAINIGPFKLEQYNMRDIHSFGVGLTGFRIK